MVDRKNAGVVLIAIGMLFPGILWLIGAIISAVIIGSLFICVGIIIEFYVGLVKETGKKLQKRGLSFLVVGLIITVICLLLGWAFNWNFYFGMWFGYTQTYLFYFFLIVGIVLVIIGLLFLVVSIFRKTK